MKDKSTRAQYGKYVVGVEVAQRLKQAGFTAPTMFYWVINAQLDSVNLYQAGMEYFGPQEHRYAAPTAAEIKEHFPDKVWISVNNNRSHLRRQGIFYFTKFNGKYIVSLMVPSDQTGQIYEVHREEDVSEADSCGLMYCHIYENGLDQLHS